MPEDKTAGQTPKEDKYPGKTPKEVAALVGIDHVETHLFLCTGPTCCAEADGEASWHALKAKVKEVYPQLPLARMYRTRANCLRICKEGPIAVAYPQGKWFQGVTADRVGELVDYLCSGSTEPHPLEFKQHPLPKP